eukprot:1181422-Prorocentrum_minimum.AAC.2
MNARGAHQHAPAGLHVHVTAGVQDGQIPTHVHVHGGRGGREVQNAVDLVIPPGHMVHRVAPDHARLEPAQPNRRIRHDRARSTVGLATLARPRRRTNRNRYIRKRVFRLFTGIRYTLTTDQSDTGSAGTFSRRTNQTQESQVYYPSEGAPRLPLRTFENTSSVSSVVVFVASYGIPAATAQAPESTELKSKAFLAVDSGACYCSGATHRPPPPSAGSGSTSSLISSSVGCGRAPKSLGAWCLDQSREAPVSNPGANSRPATWRSVGREHPSNVRWNIRNAVR